MMAQVAVHLLVPSATSRNNATPCATSRNNATDEINEANEAHWGCGHEYESPQEEAACDHGEAGIQDLGTQAKEAGAYEGTQGHRLVHQGAACYHDEAGIQERSKEAKRKEEAGCDCTCWRRPLAILVRRTAVVPRRFRWAVR